MENKYTNFAGDNLDNFLGHEMIEIKEDYVESKLVVTKDHKQPMGLVHGGIYSTLLKLYAHMEQILVEKVCL